MRRLPFPLFLAGQVLLSGCSHQVESYYRRRSLVPAVICALLVSMQSGGSPSFPPLCPGGCDAQPPVLTHRTPRPSESRQQRTATARYPRQIGLEGGEALPSAAHRPPRVVDRAAIRAIGRRLRQLRKHMTPSESVSHREGAQLLRDASTARTKLLTSYSDAT